MNSLEAIARKSVINMYSHMLNILMTAQENGDTLKDVIIDLKDLLENNVKEMDG